MLRAQQRMCVYCGYALHSRAGLQCSECGRVAPRELLDVPACLLLPWERYINRRQVYRVIHTVASGTLGFPSYLRTFASRGYSPLYQGRVFAIWLILASCLAPILIGDAIMVFYPSFVRGELSVRSVREGIQGVIVSNNPRFFLTFWGRVATFYIAQIALFGVWLVMTSRFSNRRVGFVEAVCSVAPVILLLRTAQVAAVYVLGIGGVEPGLVPRLFVKSATLIGVPLFLALAARFAFRQGWVSVVIVAVALGLLEFLV